MRTTLVLAAAMVLAGCDPLTTTVGAGKADGGSGTATPAPRAGGGFAHSQTEDLSGYYEVGQADVGPAGFRLMRLFVGQAQAFADWEEGKRSATFAPVMLEFLGPGGTTERVLPETYSVSDDRIRMAARTASGERISLDAQMNTGALATARRTLGGGEEAALTAVVVIGDRTWSGVKLGWSGGD